MSSPIPREAPSLRRLNDILYGTGIVVSLLLICSLISVIASFFYLDGLSAQESEMLRRVNALAITVQESPDYSGPAVLDAYIGVRQSLLSGSDLLVRGVSIPFPSFSSAEGGQAYRESIRSLAAGVRQNREGIRKGTEILNLTLIILSVIGILALLGVTRSNRNATRGFLSGIERGIASLDELLQNKAPAPPEFPGFAIAELDELFRRISRVSALIDLDHSMGTLSGTGDMNQLLRRLYGMVKGFMPCERAGLAFITSNSRVTAEATLADYPVLHLTPGYSEPLERTTLGRVALTQSPRVIDDLEAYAAGREVSHATRLLMKEGVRSSLTVPLLFRDKCVGFIFVASRRAGTYAESHGRELFRIASAIGHTIYTEYVIQETIAETTKAFVSLMSEKDNETSLHITRMSHYSYIIAREYSAAVSSLDPAFIRDVLWFSPLHDIGKIGIPDGILRKEGPLSAEERAVMERHVEIGERVMSAMDLRLGVILSRQNLRVSLEIIAGHHERYDGQGYPRGLAGEAIPLAGRIVAVADVFDALTSRRPYKDAWPVEEALRTMRGDMAGHFDPVVLSCLEAGLADAIEIYEHYKEV